MAFQWSSAGETSGFGQVRDGRPFWTGDFSGTGRTELLFYYPGNHEWMLGRHTGTQLEWSLVGNTEGFGQVRDGRPFWTGDFSGTGRTELLFYYPGNHEWMLGRHTGTQLEWSLVGNTEGFGQVRDGRPFWTGDFSGTGRTELLFYYPGNHEWQLGRHDGTQLEWSLVGNTEGFGQVRDGRPFWTGDFSGTGRTELLFYYPGNHEWQLGRHDGTQLEWSLVGNTEGFGQVRDGRPFWTGDFSGTGRTELLFYYPGNHEWMLGRHTGTQLEWSLVGNTEGFGQVRDGRPFWTGDFSGTGRTELLFYYPGNHEWQLGRHDGTQLEWSLVGNTEGFGQVRDGRPFWTGDFSGTGRTELLFYYPGNHEWMLATMDSST